MTDWTKKRANATKSLRYVTHYGHPDCPHAARTRRARMVDDVMVVTCTACGMETRFESTKAAGFPRQAS